MRNRPAVLFGLLKFHREQEKDFVIFYAIRIIFSVPDTTISLTFAGVSGIIFSEQQHRRMLKIKMKRGN